MKQDLKKSKRTTILTADRPTGALHIGHYFGSLINRKKYENEFDTYIMVADIQALTDNWDNPEKVHKNVLEVAIDNLAMGLDIKNKTTIFIQSQIPQIAELTVLYSNLVTVSRLKRNPTVKTEIKQKEDKFGDKKGGVTYGFLGYPVSQTADITCFEAEVVPVGIDQLPMIEQAREIVEKFNKIYGADTLVSPEALLSDSPKVLGLDGNSKMSKSLNNCIYLKDSEQETIDKIKVATTDSLDYFSYEPKTRPEISNLVKLFSLCLKIEIKDALEELKGVRYGVFKQKLAEVMNSYFADLRAKRKELEAKPEVVWDILKNGKQKALVKAEKTLEKVKKAVFIDY
jgi:tryptophanyl-tRNA synthetase